VERVVCGTILGIWQSFLELHTKPIKWRHVTEHGRGIITTATATAAAAATATATAAAPQQLLNFTEL